MENKRKFTNFSICGILESPNKKIALDKDVVDIKDIKEEIKTEVKEEIEVIEDISGDTIPLVTDLAKEGTSVTIGPYSPPTLPPLSPPHVTLHPFSLPIHTLSSTFSSQDRPESPSSSTHPYNNTSPPSSIHTYHNTSSSVVSPRSPFSMPPSSHFVASSSSSTPSPPLQNIPESTQHLHDELHQIRQSWSSRQQHLYQYLRHLQTPPSYHSSPYSSSPYISNPHSTPNPYATPSFPSWTQSQCDDSRPRRPYSKRQVSTLAWWFHHLRFVSMDEMEKLGKIVELSRQQIKVWWQNRRHSEKGRPKGESDPYTHHLQGLPICNEIRNIEVPAPGSELREKTFQALLEFFYRQVMPCLAPRPLHFV